MDRLKFWPVEVKLILFKQVPKISKWLKMIENRFYLQLAIPWINKKYFRVYL